MSKRKRLTGKAEEMRQVAQVLRQNGLSKKAVKGALLAMCGVEVMMTDNGSSFSSRMTHILMGKE